MVAPPPARPLPATPSTEPRSGRAAVGALELAYDLFAPRPDAPLLVLVMGIGAQRVFWPDAWCQALAAHDLRVVRFDHRDIGQSSRLDDLAVPDARRALVRRLLGVPAPAPYSLSDMAGDVVGLIDHLGAERAHLVGVSMGGMIGQLAAIEHPARVGSLASIMSSPGATRFALGARPSALRALLGPAPRSAEQAGEHAVRTFTVLGGGGLPVDTERLRAAGAEAFARGLSARGFLRHFAAICAAPDRTAALARVTAPTVVLHGDRDPLIPAAAGRATARAIPGARLEIVPGMGHHLPSAVWPTLIAAIVDNLRRPGPVA
ncbi:MAG: alpha/beta fold hydrolase [Kofleriaceae bacterium]|nr:alpha/beta fold hydrolase [Kofleriaceae bacterium]